MNNKKISAVFMSITMSAILLVSLHFGGVSGCGVAASRGAAGGGGDGGDGGGDTISATDSVAVIGSSISLVSSSVQSSLSSAITSVSSQAGLKAKNTLATNDECVYAEVSDGFSVTCSCSGGGTSVMSMTGTFTESTCDNADQTTGFIFTSSGTVTMTYSGCIETATCGASENIATMDGTITGTMTSDYNECDGTNVLETTMTTPGGLESCDGLTITVDSTEIQMGMEMTLTEGFCGTEGTATQTLTIPVCVNGTSYASFEEMEAALDPDGTCSEEAGAALVKNVAESCVDTDAVDYSEIFNSESCTNPPDNQMPSDTDSYSYAAMESAVGSEGAYCFAEAAYESGETGCVSYASVVETCEASRCSNYCFGVTGDDSMLLGVVTPVDVTAWQDTGSGRLRVAYEFSSAVMTPDTVTSVRFLYDGLTDAALSIELMTGPETSISIVEEVSAVNDLDNHILCSTFTVQPEDTYVAELFSATPGAAEAIWETGNTCGNPWP